MQGEDCELRKLEYAGGGTYIKYFLVALMPEAVDMGLMDT